MIVLLSLSFLKKDYKEFIIDINNRESFLIDEDINYLIKGTLKDSSSKGLFNIEKKINGNSYIKKTEVFANLNNKILINVDQYKPFARLINQKGRDYYIDFNGEIFPTSTIYSERVLLVNFYDTKITKEKNIKFFQKGDKIFKLIKYINNDDFWRKQITQINILKDGDIIMIPQITKQKIYFGDTQEIDLKFKKLLLFYKVILPTKGWNYYESVNLKYKNQIVCDKKNNV